MTNKQKNILISVLFLIFGAFLIYQSSGIKQRMPNDMGSGFFPMVVGVSIIAMSIIRFITAIKEADGAAKKGRGDVVGGIATIVLIGLYVAAFNDIGFIITTFLFLLAEMLVLTPKEKRSMPVILAISVIAPIAIYALFVYAINSPLPKGIFGF